MYLIESICVNYFRFFWSNFLGLSLPWGCHSLPNFSSPGNNMCVCFFFFFFLVQAITWFFNFLFFYNDVVLIHFWFIQCTNSTNQKHTFYDLPYLTILALRISLKWRHAFMQLLHWDQNYCGLKLACHFKG